MANKIHIVQAGLVLCNFFLNDFTLTQSENLHHFSNIHDNFQFNAIWYEQSLAAFVLYWRLEESNITVMPSIMCRDWLCWWYIHAADIVPL